MNPPTRRAKPIGAPTAAPAGRLARSCPTCDAPIGWRCAKWITVDGITYRDKFLKVPHPARTEQHD